MLFRNRRNVNKQEPKKVSENKKQPEGLGDQQPEAVEVKSQVQVSGFYSCSYSLSYRAFLHQGVYKTPEGQDILVKSENRWRCPSGLLRNLEVPQSNIISEKKVHKAKGVVVAPFCNFSGEVEVHTEEGPGLNRPIGFKTQVLGMGISGVSIVTPVDHSDSEKRNVR